MTRKQHRDIDHYNQPYVWEISLADFDIDQREYDDFDDSAICPCIDIKGYCGHSWGFCRDECPTRKKWESEVPQRVKASPANCAGSGEALSHNSASAGHKKQSQLEVFV